VRLKKGRLPLMVSTVLFTAASTWAIVHLYDPTAINNTRAYEGTDARAAALLVGAFAAMLAPFDRLHTLPARVLKSFNVVGVIGLIGVSLCIILVGELSSFLYRGGELVLATCTIALTLAAAYPSTYVARLLSVPTLRWIGERSYGIYLWHMPVAAFMPEETFASQPILRGLLQLSLILGLAALSFRFIEDPIRRGAEVPPLRLAFRSGVFVPVATIALAVWPLSWHSSSNAEPLEALEAIMAEPEPSEVTAQVTPTSIAAALPPGAPATSCKELIHIGDSTSIGLVSKSLLPNVDDRVAARYQAAGVEKFFPEISGARSMVETYKEKPNATQVAKTYRAKNYKGCWVLALGTNDPANTKGDSEMLAARIDALMKVVNGDPVMWTTTKTLRDKGAYKNTHMESWNKALTEACKRHPNMRVYDWASEVQDDWYTPDGIHFNSPGYKERAIRLSTALMRAFPKEGGSPSECLVHAN
jgi:lysophospholipase L1-like esterase